MKSYYLSPESRWLALQNRDPLADGHFVYSVTTTGIYCRPGCPSKLALRANISFHENCSDAERSGFRPCKRCHPNTLSRTALRTAAVATACRLIEAAESPPTLAELAAAACLSRFHFHRIFKEVTGVTPAKYAAAHRSKKVRAALLTSPSVTAAIQDAGFNSSSRFYEDSPQILGMTTRQYRSGGQDVSIRWAIAACPLGLVLVAGTTRGICHVSFGYERKVLECEIRERFPKANFDAPDGGFNEWVKTLVSHLRRPNENLNLPLDICCTAFQQRVWQALREIPSGITASYAEIAARIGQPTAARAVARACATNAVAVVIPCHRVVGNKGDLTGYRWGIERKRQLLRQEADGR